METLLKKIEELYGLRLDLAKRVAEGFLSENFILSDGAQKKFLKKYRSKDAERIAEIHLAKKYFSDGGIPVIMPVSDKDGKGFFQHEENFYTLFPFVESRKLGEMDFTETALASTARMLGSLHLLGRDSKLPIKEALKPWNTKGRLKDVETILEIISAITEKTDFDIRAEKNLLLKKRIMESNQGAFEQFDLRNNHLIHGDYLTGNLFFDKDDNVSHVFDFEKMGYAPRYFELFRSMIYSTLLDEDVTDEDLARAKLYLDSYRTVYPATKEELTNAFTAYYLRSAHSIWIESERYLKGNNRADQLLRTNALRLSYLSQNFEKMSEYLFG